MFLPNLAFTQQNTADLLLQYNQFKGNPVSEADVTVCNQLSEKYLFLSTDSAFQFAQVALSNAKKLKLERERARALVNIAKIGYISGSFYQSLTYADSALTLSEQIDYVQGLAGSINTRGLIYLAQNRFADAIPEFQKAIVHNYRLKDSSRIAANYFNIGLCYDELHQSKAAFVYLNKALQIALQCKDWHMNQMTLNRLGEAYYHLKNYSQALFFFQSALNFLNYQDNWEKTFAYSGISRARYEMGDYYQAKIYAEKAYLLAKQLKASWDIERALNILAKCYAALNDYKNAYKYQTISRTYADSLLNEQKEKEINYLHLRDKNSENIKLVRENQYNRQVIKSNKIILSLATLFVLFLITILFILRRSISHKNKLNQELRESNSAVEIQKAEIQAQQKALIALNRTKDRVLSIIGHDLRIPFASVLPALEMMNNGELDEEEQKMIMKGFHRQVVLVAGLTNNLLAWANSQQSGSETQMQTVELNAVAEEVIALYYSVYSSKQQLVSHMFDDSMLVQGDPQHIRIILQNIISNAIKFTPKGGLIEVFYTKSKGFISIHIKDTGKGMSPEKLKLLFVSSGSSISERGTDQELGNGLGLLLIKQFVEENGGYIKVKSEVGKGSEFIVYFKAAIADLVTA